jgi:DNA polymerase
MRPRDLIALRSLMPKVAPAPIAAVRTLHYDVESRSAAKLGKGKNAVGTRAYAEHPTTSVLCVAYALDGGPVEIWLPGQPVPEIVLAAAADPSCRWVAHHAAFERAILEAILVPQHGWPMVPAERHVCTMALALSHGCPGSLEGAAAMLGLANQKDAKAAKEVRVMWKPRKPKRGEDPKVLYWVDTPEPRAKLHGYCKQDVVAERELHHRLSALPAEEQEAWVIDAEINDRGVLIDAPLAQAASHLVVKALRELDALINEKTNGVVDKASKTQKLKAWLVAQGLKLPCKSKKKEDEELEWHDSFDAEDIEKLLAGALPNERVREVLEIRLKAAQSAVSKIDRMLITRCADGRVRIFTACTAHGLGDGQEKASSRRI